MTRSSAAPVRASLPLLAVMLLLAPVPAARAGLTPNLIRNGDAETGNTSDWVDVLGHGYNVSSASHSGAFCFWGGVAGPSGGYTHELVQDVALDAYASLIDAGAVTAHFSGWGRSNEASGVNDVGGLTVEYRNASSALASFGTTLFAPFNTWLQIQDQRVLPVGTRSARIHLLASRSFGASSDGGQDDLSLVLESPNLDAPASTALASRLRLASSNPARGTAASRLEFGTTSPGRVRVTVLDAAGRRLRRLFDDVATSGTHSVDWDGRDAAGTRVPAGLFFVRLESEERLETVRVARLP